MRDLLWPCFRRKLRPRQVTGDTTYGTVENIVALENAGIEPTCRCPTSVPGARLLRPGRLRLRRRSRRLPLSGGPSPFRRAKAKREQGTGLPRPGDLRTSRSRCTENAKGRTVTAPSTRTTWRRCAPTTRPRRTRRRCASAGCGSSRSSPRPRRHGLRRMRLRGPNVTRAAGGGRPASSGGWRRPDGAGASRRAGLVALPVRARGGQAATADRLSHNTGAGSVATLPGLFQQAGPLTVP